MSKRLDGKVALVTGGTSGIGAGTVCRLIAEGAKVAFTGSNKEAAAKITAETGASFQPNRVEDAAGWPLLMDELLKRYLRLDITFANAVMASLRSAGSATFKGRSTWGFMGSTRSGSNQPRLCARCRKLRSSDLCQSCAATRRMILNSTAAASIP